MREAAKASWKIVASNLEAKNIDNDAIKVTASQLIKAKFQAGENAFISIGLPIPDDVYTILLRCKSTNENELSLEISLFVYHLPQLLSYLREHQLEKGIAAGWISLQLLDSGDLQVKWLNKASLQEQIDVLQLLP